MAETNGRESAMEPEELDRFFIERANARDVEGVVALYESDAVMSSADGLVSGTAAIRLFYQDLLSDPPFFAGDIQPALRHGNVALTSTRFAGGATAEIARLQTDGSWLWVADQPNVAG
jgi:ketosteroid isomerase-like protein